jgi:transcriptional regulator with XRE-family HTH domain
MDIEGIRKELNLKPVEFASALGVSKGYAGDLRSGRRDPSLRVLARLETLTKRKFVKAAVREIESTARQAASSDVA